MMTKGLALVVLGLFAGQVGAAAIYPAQSTNNNTSFIEPRAADYWGINCKGSSFCGGGHVGTFALLATYLDLIDDKDHFSDGDHIVCSTSLICVFPQYTTFGISGAEVKKLFKELTKFECDVCGSIPTGYFDGNDDLSDGELTVNYVGGVAGCCGPCDGYNHKDKFPECLGPP